MSVRGKIYVSRTAEIELEKMSKVSDITDLEDPRNHFVCVNDKFFIRLYGA